MIFVSVFMVDCLFWFMLFFSLNYCFAAVVLIATNKVEYIKEELEAAHHEFQRRLLGISWKEKVWNDVVREKTALQKMWLNYQRTMIETVRARFAHGRWSTVERSHAFGGELYKTNARNTEKMIICDKNSVYRIYFASCMNIIFNELRQQQIKYVHTTNKINSIHAISYHILFLLLIYFNWNYFVMRGNTTRRAWVDLLSKRKHVKISLAVGA